MTVYMVLLNGEPVGVYAKVADAKDHVDSLPGAKMYISGVRE